MHARLLEVIAISAILDFSPFSPSKAQEAPAVGPDLSKYTLVFDEEFSGPLNVPSGYGWGSGGTTKWITHTPYAGDFGEAYFTGPGEPGTDDPFSIGNGILTIKAWRDPNANYHWRSGLLSSAGTDGKGFSQRFGYFECRMKLPSGVGVWPAFWLGDADGVMNPGQTKAEIDILEAYGDDPTAAYHAVHIWNPDASGAWSLGNQSLKNGLTSDYHTYAALVNSDYIHFYIDGVEQWKTPTYPEATHRLYVMVNLALGGGQSTDNTPNPSYLLVDYIRVYAPPNF
jgi:beta-glucanase (GH16 family)